MSVRLAVAPLAILIGVLAPSAWWVVSHISDHETRLKVLEKGADTSSVEMSLIRARMASAEALTSGYETRLRLLEQTTDGHKSALERLTMKLDTVHEVVMGMRSVLTQVFEIEKRCEERLERDRNERDADHRRRRDDPQG